MWLDSTYTEGELKMKAKVFTRIIYVIVAGIFLFSAGKLIYHYGDSYLSEKEFDELKTNNKYELKQLQKKNKERSKKPRGAPKGSKNALGHGAEFGGFWAKFGGCWAATHTRPFRSLG